jgi:hypothetical protein
LGFVSISMGVIPFVFIKYGAWLRKNSIVAQRAAPGNRAPDITVQQG